GLVITLTLVSVAVQLLRRRTADAAGRWRAWHLAVVALPALAVIGLAGVWLHHSKKNPVVNVTVGREYVPDVDESGFSMQQFAKDGQPFRWTEGAAKLVIPIDRAHPPAAAEVRLFPWRPAQANPATLRLVVN